MFQRLQFPLPEFKAPLDAHVAPGISVIVSLKVFVVELKNNCPSVICENTDGAINCSVDVTLTGVVLSPPIASDAEALCPAELLHSSCFS